ncbi:TPA: hypothetical protein MNE64_001503 [Escherichia coli]|nr:hypothetical protein [Escherichia coli]
MKHEHLTILLQDERNLTQAIKNAVRSKINKKEAELSAIRNFIEYFGSTPELEKQLKEAEAEEEHLVHLYDDISNSKSQCSAYSVTTEETISLKSSEDRSLVIVEHKLNSLWSK